MNPIKPPHTPPGASPSFQEDNTSTDRRHVRSVPLLLRPFATLFSALIYIPKQIRQFVLRSFSPEKRLMNQVGNAEEIRKRINEIAQLRFYTPLERDIVYQALNVKIDADSPEQIDTPLSDQVLNHYNPLKAATAVIRMVEPEIMSYREKILANRYPIEALAIVLSFMGLENKHRPHDTELYTALDLYKSKTKSSEQEDMLLLDRILQQKDHKNPISSAVAMINLESEDSREVISYKEKILAHSDPEEALITVQNFVKPQEEHGLPAELLDEIIEKTQYPSRALEACIELQKRGLLSDKHKMQVLTHEEPHYMAEVLIVLNGEPDLSAEFINCAYSHSHRFALAEGLIKPLIMLGAADAEIMESALDNSGYYISTGALNILLEAKAEGMTIPSDFVHFIMKLQHFGLWEPAATLAIQLLELGITDVKVLQLACENNEDDAAEKIKILTELIGKGTPMSPEAVYDALNGHGNTQ